MKIASLALLICAGFSFSTHAAQSVENDMAWQGNSYPSVIVKLKPSESSQQKSQPLLLSDTTLSVTTLFKHQGLRSNELAEMSRLDRIYGFDRYLRVNIPETRSNDIDYINGIIQEIKQNSHVELVYPESAPVSLDKIAGDMPPLTTSGLSYALDSSRNSGVPDFRHLQDYKKSPTEKRTGYYMGGVNRDSINQYPGNDGAGISLVSAEIDPWNPNHINLPDVSFYEGDKTYRPGADHGTSAVGIMAAKDIGTGIKGLTWRSRMGYTNAAVENLYKMIPRLQAGDVVQFGVQTNGGEVTGCTSSCWMPMENYDAYYNIIKALTDKGVHVIQAAANGNINLDDPAFKGKFDLKKRDSGSILAGAFCASDGKKAFFSTYGSRVTSAGWGCWDVVTTGYGDLHRAVDAEYTGTFSGTSSANPIIAGVVASLSGIAKANGITVSPVKMREILQQTGTPLAAGDSARIGTQPDMAKAVEKILELKEDGNVGHPVAVAGEDRVVSATGDTSRAYELDGSASQNAVSWRWTISKGADKFWLQEKHAGPWVRSVSGVKARALIPANTDGEVTYRLTVKNKNGEEAFSDITVKVNKAPQINQDQTFIAALKLGMQSVDNGDSMTFTGKVMSDTVSTSAPQYHWLLPAGAQGGGNQATQSFTLSKKAQPQYLKVEVKVQAGKEKRTLTQTITVPAAEIPGNSIEQYNARIAYPVKCTSVSWQGQVWLNQWYVNAGQEEPGTGGQWGAWRKKHAANNTCP